MNRKKIILNLFKKAYLIRTTEELIIKHYDNNEMKTPMHMSMGEEAIMAGVCTALGKNSQTFGTYRSHGLYLAVTEETDKFFAEMYGKVTGVLKGKSGSMHLLSPSDGLLGISAVVGSTIPLAVGAAFANIYLKKKQITTVFFGDGAVDEGVFWESLNIACSKGLPVLFVCEDNGYAVHTPLSARRGYKSLTNIVKQYSCSVFETDSTDAEQIYKLSLEAINSIQKKHRPAFLHLKYYRYLEHVGVHEDFHAGYRTKLEFMEWQKKDPVKLLRNKLKDVKVKDMDIIELEERINKQVEESLQKAKKAPFPDPSELLKNTFYEQTA
ncbi:MAG: Pyruvate/2-oxoglutarate dehydrogenase complex,dehydrogenase (E1) component, alpha subunit [Microgenomates group bacterium Gr01-1014_7]|nr:MAG: Pyruvate/2-oxoglutarate dehydrogenase complex,dehydrogenase (E1) component, alpha subunit [Microgenomates group bacterium Gr01-1014_7]